MYYFFLHFNRKPIRTKGHHLNASKIVDILDNRDSPLLVKKKTFCQARFLYLCPHGRI